MYLFGLPKDEVMSQKHVVSYQEISKENSISMVTLFGKQVYPAKSESSKSNAEHMNMKMKDIDLRLPADHYSFNNHETLESAKSYNAELGFRSRNEANKMIETSTRKCSGNRNPKIVIDLEEPLTWSSEQSPISHIAKTPEQNALQIDQSLVKNCKDIDFIKEGRVETSDKELGLLDLNQTPIDDSTSEQPHYCFLQDLNCPYTETSCEKSEIEDDITPIYSPHREKEGTSSPTSYTSCCTTENNSRSRNSSSPRQELEPEAKPSCRAKLEFSNNKEDSEMIQMAANSLVHISTISQFEDSQIVANSLQDRNFITLDAAKPGCSCDSYELHTLGISENLEEDCCVSSMADLDEIKISNDNNKEIGLKLRRGRRMKNFQKEILPSLMSLSRHEIREDINILEAVLRSREYKKMQGKNKCGRPLMNVPRNKRSLMQQRCVGRRRR